MGHREDLLEGAKKCLYERGYARTTARDIVEASGTNLGSIGYHYGTKEDLLDTALIDVMKSFGEESSALTIREFRNAGNPTAIFDIWIKDFDHMRNLVISQVEAWAQVEHSPRLREKLSEYYEDEIERCVRELADIFPDRTENEIRLACAVSSILGDGLQARWLINPDQVPSGNDIVKALRLLADTLDSSQAGKASLAVLPGDPPVESRRT